MIVEQVQAKQKSLGEHVNTCYTRQDFLQLPLEPLDFSIQFEEKTFPYTRGQLSPKALRLFSETQCTSICLEDISGIVFETEGGILQYKEHAFVAEHVFYVSEQEADSLYRYWNAVQIRQYLENHVDESVRIAQCNYCHSYYNKSFATGELSFCAYCSAINSPSQCLNICEGRVYNFSEDASFALMFDQSKPFLADDVVFSAQIGMLNFWQRFTPIAEKISGHALWAVFFLSLTFLKPIVSIQVILYVLIFVNVTLALYYMTLLVMGGGLRPFIRKTAYDKVLQNFSRGKLQETIVEMEKESLMKHPGFIFNLYLLYKRKGEEELAVQYLEKAKNLVPNHPLILSACIEEKICAASELEKVTHANFCKALFP